ncbi:MAG: hybrid sensor histidine kinase/response regulator [Telluria sp.]
MTHPSLPPETELYEHAPCGLLLTAADGTILRANATVSAWLGYLPNELLHRRVLNLLPVGARVFHHTHCLPILQVQGSLAELQVELLRRDGTRIPTLINILRRDHGGVIFDEWAVFRAADRRSYEQELLAARKTAESALDARLEAEERLKKANTQLSQADRRKDEFLATLSHELRNPLAPMRNALEVLKLDLPPQSRMHRMMGVCERQLQQLTHLVDDLMEVSRITQGRMELRREPIGLAAVMRAAADDLAPTMAAAGHTLTVATPAAPACVNADATRLTQVVVNLLTNAAKYTPRGGMISLSGSVVGDEAVISVRDNGIGIPAESLGTIFEMFSQLTPALERSNGGLGIGLALVRGIVELHGGSISATSDGPGRGSEFTVRLPLAEPAGLSIMPDATPAPRVPARVLVVDDNCDAADTLVLALELLGCTAKNAYTAAGGLDLVTEFAPQVALLDIGLPDLNGYELAHRIRAMPGGESMTLVAVTGWGQQADKERALAAGFNHHLTKPIDFGTLEALLAGAGN